VDEKFFFSFCLAELMELKNKNREPETHAEQIILEKNIQFSGWEILPLFSYSGRELG
jgi:hypothetical protein